MNLRVEQEILAAEYRRAMINGRRAKAKALHERMRAIVCAILAGGMA